MKRRILVLRHAKSDWDAPYDADHDRPLAVRGERACRAVGRALARANVVSDLVLSSTALRARETARLTLESAGVTCPPVLEPELYESDPAFLLTRLCTLPELVVTVLVVNHEPTCSGLVSLLQGGGNVRMPTAALACLVTEEPWPALEPGSCALQWLVKPRLLDAWVD